MKKCLECIHKEVCNKHIYGDTDMTLDEYVKKNKDVEYNCEFYTTVKDLMNQYKDMLDNMYNKYMEEKI